MSADATIRHTDVCIIGAGPAGLLLANALQQSGVPCIVIDRRSVEEISSQGRAGSLDCKTVSILEQYDLADSLLRTGRRNSFCEFRTPLGSVMFDYGAHSDGRFHYQYPQQRLVEDMAQAFAASGGQIEYSTSAREIEMESAEGRSRVQAIKGTTSLTIHCRYVAGCDGHHGIGRATVDASMSDNERADRVFSTHHPFQWLTILAEAQPSSGHTVYALHQNGFAAHMRRDDRVSRFYLQTPVGESLEEWPDDRIWREIHLRLAQHGWELAEGAIIHRDILLMRSYVLETLRYRNLFLAGDAAHLITPCGGKGLNLAVQDAAELAEELTWLLGHVDDVGVTARDTYEKRRLPAIWRAQAFSSSMLEMLHTTTSSAPSDAFGGRLNASRIQQLATNALAARTFAEGYLGLSL